jgi:hypothetical protein
MEGWLELAGVAFVVLVFLYIAVTTWFDSSINSRGTTRNRGISGERGDDYRDRSAL